MKMTGGITVIKGTGGLVPIMDGIVNTEVMRQRELEHQTYRMHMAAMDEKYKAQTERINTLQKQRDILMKYASQPKRKRNPLKECFAYVCACFIVWKGKVIK